MYHYKRQNKMIKCNITACGTIGRDASMRTTKEEKTFLTFPLRVVLQGKDGRNETVEISVSKEGGQKKVSGYRNGLRVEVAGTLFLKRRGEKLYFNLFADRIGLAADIADSIKGELSFRGKVGKNIEERKDKRISPIRCSLHSAPKRSMRISSTSGCVSSASTGNVKSGCNRASR